MDMEEPNYSKPKTDEANRTSDEVEVKAKNIEEPDFSKLGAVGTRLKDDSTRNEIKTEVKERDEDDMEGSFTWMDPIVKYLKNR